MPRVELRSGVKLLARRIHVVAGVLTDLSGRVLLSRRPTAAHQGGLWEFPGGKLETGESAETALRREFKEELGVKVTAARPLIRVPYDYPDRSVLLDVWRVTRWQNQPRGLEHQDIDWVPPDQLHQRAMPPADIPIVNAIRLPACYAITPPPAAALDAFLSRLESMVQGPATMVQLRAHELDDASFTTLARTCVKICRRNGATLMLNRDPGLVLSTDAHGVHLTSARLRALDSRPLGKDLWVGVSCHDTAELRRAGQIGADFAVLSCVRRTPSHANRPSLGWDGFNRLVRDAGLPVYALGGVEFADLEVSWQNGAQGIAGIRTFWAA